LVIDASVACVDEQTVTALALLCVDADTAEYHILVDDVRDILGKKASDIHRNMRLSDMSSSLNNRGLNNGDKSSYNEDNDKGRGKDHKRHS